MVHLILASSKGNHSIRYFPYSGYLGLTTLKVDGVVRTKLDADLKPLQAKSITISVRCYEARLGRFGVMHSNVLVDYTQVLWSKPDDEDYADIGDLELPFRIAIPAKVAGFSTVSFPEYRATWRVEAIINHANIIGVGSRQIKHSELPLQRFGLPPAFEPSTPLAQPVLDSEITHPHCPSIRYSVHSPITPIGPLDLVSIPIHLLPRDPGISFRSASVIIERRMCFMDPVSPPSTPTALLNTSPPLPTPSSSHHSSSLPIPQRTYSSSSSLSYSPSSSYQESTSHLSSSSTLQPSDSRASTNGASPLVNSVAGSESSGLFARADSGVWSKTLTLQWPAAKSHSRWAIGETIESELVSVKFIVRVKIVVSSPFGTESLELEEKELLVVSTNETERQLALAKYNDAYSDSARSKSKSPRRSRRLNDDAPPLPASASRAEHSHRISSSSSHYSSASPSKPPRRPHTSAGPRDKSRTGGSVSGREAGSKDTDVGDLCRRRRGARPGTGGDAEIAASHSVGKGYFHPPLTVATSAAADSGGSASSTSLSTSSSSAGSNASDEMREWEEELARIEMRSRRSSDLAGFSKRRKPSVSR
ncbi:hypothetical protein C8R44DRAFT_801886 [Mycena epipterygia]|nr:hypothetical protein C8R44DRAFT_801886 [Mycena epipterygia]